MQTLKLTTIVVALTAVVGLLFAAFGLKPPSHQSFGSATPGLAASASTTLREIQVGPQEDKLLFPASTGSVQCAARIVSTKELGIMLSFSGNTGLTQYTGHWQAASTTVAYDGGLYGCGAWWGAAGVSTTIVMSDTR